jgi:hypothetical protein
MTDDRGVVSAEDRAHVEALMDRRNSLVGLRAQLAAEIQAIDAEINAGNGERP